MSVEDLKSNDLSWGILNSTSKDSSVFPENISLPDIDLSGLSSIIAEPNENLSAKTYKSIESSVEARELLAVSENVSAESAVEITELEFNTTAFEVLEKKMIEKRLENEIKFNILYVDPDDQAKQNKKVLKDAIHIECSFFLDRHDIDICRNYNHNIVSKRKRRCTNENTKTRDHYVIALIYILRIKYSQFNPHCQIKIISKNRNRNGWLFYAECIHQSCRCYRFKVERTFRNEDIDKETKIMTLYSVKVFVNKHLELVHCKEPIGHHVKGLERRLQMKALQNKPPFDVRQQMALNNDKKKLVNKNVLKKISSEARLVLNRDADDFIDLTKMALENRSYIKQVNRIPFSVTSYSEQIFNLFRKRKDFSPIFYLDGTGSAVKFSDAEKRVQIYSVLAYNLRTNHSVPITTFVTESHKAVDFNNWLNNLRSGFESGNTTRKLAHIIKIVSVDWSWALIGGTIRALNNRQHTVPEYIQDCFKTNIDDQAVIDFTVIHMCYNHFMHVVSIDISNLTHNSSIKHKMMECMRLAVQSKDLESLNEIFLLMIIIFCSETKSELFLQAMTKLANKTIFGQTDNNEDSSDSDDIFAGQNIRDKSRNDRIFLDSPYFTFFDGQFKKHLTCVINNDKGKESNPFFFKNFLENVILKKYLPICCFWSNIITFKVDENIETISNARIEQFFRLIKHNILHHHMHQRASSFLRQLQRFNNSVIKLIGLGVEDVYSTKKGRLNAKNRQIKRLEKGNKLQNLEDETDNWKSYHIPKGK